MRVLKNLRRTTFKTHFRSKDLIFKAKHSKIFDWSDEEKRGEYHHWLSIWPGALIDITSRKDIQAKLKGGEK